MVKCVLSKLENLQGRADKWLKNDKSSKQIKRVIELLHICFSGFDSPKYSGTAKSASYTDSDHFRGLF